MGANFRVKAGKEPDLLEAGKTVMKHFDRLGVTFFVVRQVDAPKTRNIITVHQFSGWNHFAKAQSDPEWAIFGVCVRTPNWRAGE